MPQEKYLCDLQVNQSAVVKDIKGANDSLTQRIINLGISKGSRITALFRSPFNDPTAYRVKGCVIALRKSDCKNISVILDERSRP